MNFCETIAGMNLTAALLVPFCSIFVAAAAAQSSSPTFLLPRPHRINLARPLDCHAIASTYIADHRDGRLQVVTSTGTDHLTITQVGPTLRVVAHHQSSEIPEDTDTYRITAETSAYASAVQGIRMLPVVHGLVINKETGTAIWSESDAAEVLVSDQPFATDVYMDCRN